jgi:hypothetical protein
MKYYNLVRLHTANGNVSPTNFENSQINVSGFSGSVARVIGSEERLVQAINNNGFPDKVVMDKSGASLANINLLLILAGFATMIEICQVKYLNNIIEERSLLQQWLANNG